MSPLCINLAKTRSAHRAAEALLAKQHLIALQTPLLTSPLPSLTPSPMSSPVPKPRPVPKPPRKRTCKPVPAYSRKTANDSSSSEDSYRPSATMSTFSKPSADASPDAQWQSRVQLAIVSPTLHSDLIIGLDFLQTNFIVVDAHARTAIDKRSNFDLLHPPDPTLWRIPAKTTPAATRQHLQNLDAKFKKKYAECFPTELPHVSELSTDCYHCIEVQPNARISVARAYSCPRKFCQGWKTLIDQHLAAGRIRPSSSQYASPSFIIPKSDPNVLLCWVNDYCILNEVTVPDNYPLPRVDDILVDCAKGVIWGKIDMTNSFFQTLVHPDHIKYTATLTPFGLWEWVVMPMGMRNSPATHQRRVTLALKEQIGKICHIYLDHIIIWSNSIAEHEINVAKVIEALCTVHLYCSATKSSLFCTEINFLGHHISARGVEADTSKVEKILNWPTPKCAKHVRQFLGLVRYITAFLPALAEHTAILTPLTKKECNTNFPPWSNEHQTAFNAIKQLVVGRDCLTTIDHLNPGLNKIFVTFLSFGETWETARPVAFDSRQLQGAELNYPVHEQEMLAILRALKKWRTDLLGSHITIYTDYKTLENFDHQKDLSRRQARWMEYLSQYDYDIHYIRGEDNSVADALSRLPSSYTEPQVVAPIWSITSDKSLLDDIKLGYTEDPWTKSLLHDIKHDLILPSSGINLIDDLLFIGDRLVIPKYADLRENLFRLAHDNLGHFGGDKSYATLRSSYYWPNMRRNLVTAYVPQCMECQRNKSRTTKPTGPLHPLPVPDACFSSLTIDFVGPLPNDNGFDALCTMTDRSGANIQIAPTRCDCTAEDFALLFFNTWYCENGCPDEIISDRDKLFVSRFWKAFMKLTGIKHKLSTAFHPQTDGLSERSNKTVIQCVRYHVERNQKGWVKSLPRI
ncbi:Transposon Ty3-I Gag-Pol polyprotein [Hypsizygus marmoreus]|uniref:Transposon Ty3-I Gag-Pol polyprotein n=1 Tax=Hypsizygus marmoreus TaxID=39966 RepID=A0A369JUP7_HYPMA|nr:Transposon Ty3-I Gag-Pol polyprotein [Hypsizygus marmoreus]